MSGNGGWQWWVVMATVIIRGSDSGVEMVAEEQKSRGKK